MPLFSTTLCSEIFVCTLQFSLPICVPPRSPKRLQKHSWRPVKSHLHLKMKEYECIFPKCPTGRNGFIQPSYLLWLSLCATVSVSINHLLVKLKTQSKLKAQLQNQLCMTCVRSRCLFCHCNRIRNLLNVSLELHRNSSF